MPKAKKVSEDMTMKSRPGLTPDAREKQLISLAVDVAEKQLREGTASSQVITHYLKLGTTRAQIEKEILMNQKELIVAKTESLRSAKRIEELYEKAMKSMRGYQGIDEDEDY